jgi:hypothetical protein
MVAYGVILSLSKDPERRIEDAQVEGERQQNGRGTIATRAAPRRSSAGLEVFLQLAQASTLWGVAGLWLRGHPDGATGRDCRLCDGRQSRHAIAHGLTALVEDRMDIALCCFDLNVHTLKDRRVVWRDFLASFVPNRKSERDSVARHVQGFLRRFALRTHLW